MFYCWISLSTNSAVINLASLLFNKTVNGFNSISMLGWYLFFGNELTYTLQPRTNSSMG